MLFCIVLTCFKCMAFYGFYAKHDTIDVLYHTAFLCMAWTLSVTVVFSQFKWFCTTKSLDTSSQITDWASYFMLAVYLIPMYLW